MKNCTIDSLSSLNLGQIFFMSLGILPFLTLIPTWVVAKFVWEPMEKDRKIAYELLKQRQNEFKNREPPYSEKYPIKSNIKHVKPSESNIILENTPDGYIALRYNNDEEGFEYWCEKNVSYKNLETASRKYVNTFCCPDIYIDRREHLKEKIKKLTEEINKNLEAKAKLENDTDDDEKDTDKGTSVFATLKTYNSNIKNKSEERDKLNRDDYVCDIANKYIKKGKLSDTKSWLNSKILKEDSTTLMSWLSWKKTDKNN